MKLVKTERMCDCCELSKATEKLELNGDQLCNDCYNYTLNVLDGLYKKVREVFN